MGGFRSLSCKYATLSGLGFKVLGFRLLSCTYATLFSRSCDNESSYSGFGFLLGSIFAGTIYTMSALGLGS